ncbi:MAG TPA: type II 3-dehydroquinate dehydratase [Chloroflexota bacterium]|jgi:3-dehydroquinate dehydratase-2|nr:type II 3-dehydroquinate dehydratase [Chloroflexota bacterium]
MNVLVLNGPNVNMLGVREPHIYGSTTLAQINERLSALGKELGAEVEFFHSNHEGALVDRIQAGHGQGLAGAIFNPGGLTHTSVALHDAIKAVDYPFVEVHLTNIQQREEWRQRSLIAMAAKGTIAGLGAHGYELALRYLVGLQRES